MLGHLLTITTFGSGDNAKNVKVRYLIVNVTFPYNIIICRPSFNSSETVLFPLYLTLKYSFEDGRVFTVKIGKQPLVFQITNTLVTHMINQIDHRTCVIVEIIFEK